MNSEENNCLDAETNRQQKSAPTNPSANTTTTLTPDRRQLLKAAGLTIGLSGVLPTQTVAQQEQNPPDLEYVYINITVSGDLQCLLITNEQRKHDQEGQEHDRADEIIESLSAQNPEIQAEEPAESLDGFFFDRYALDDDDPSIKTTIEDENQSSAIELFEENYSEEKYFEEYSEKYGAIRRPEYRYVETVIPGAADVPREDARFKGKPTICPEITYDGELRTERTAKQVIVQFHDGFFYQLPEIPSERKYPRERYDVSAPGGRNQPFTPIVDGLQNAPDEKASFDSVATGGYVTPNPKQGQVTQQFRHRAHPALVGLRSLAQRQSVALSALGNSLVNDEQIRTAEEFAKKLDDRASEAAKNTTGIFAPLPPDSLDPSNVAPWLIYTGGPAVIA